MRGFLLLMAMCLLAMITIAQDCSDDAIMSIKGSWAHRTDVDAMSDKTQALINARIDQIGKLYQLAYPEPKGMQAGWYRTRGNESIVSNGPIPYGFNSLYFPWYCNQHAHKMMLSSETGTWSTADVNFVRSIFSDQYNLIGIKVGDYDVFRLPPKKGIWKGYPLYETPGWNGKSYSVVIGHHGNLPWKPVSQEQYLQAVRAAYLAQKNKSSDGYTINEENIKKMMASNQNNKNLKDADREKINADLQKRLDEIEKEKGANLGKLNKGWDDKISAIDKYLGNASPADLQSAAIIDRNTELNFNGNFSTEAKGGTMLVTLDPAYFDTKLPRYAPQLVILNWRWETNTPSLDFKKQLEANFPVDKLSAMLDQ